MSDRAELMRILLVDDDEEDFILTQSMLSRDEARRFKLDWASTYEQGEQMLSTGSYDAALIDYDLGGRTGLELIRSLDISLPTPLILYSGRASHEVDVESLQAGATLYIAKGEASPLLLARSIRYAIERKRFERQLAYQAELLDSVSDAVFATDSGLRVTYWNRAAQALFGYSEAEACDRTTEELFHSEFPGITRMQAFEQLTREGRFEGEAVYHHKDGHPIPVHVRSTLLPGPQGQFGGLVAALRDISERQRNEQMLRQSLQRTDDILSSIGDAMFEVNQDWTLVYINARAEQIAGRPADELMGRNFWELWPHARGSTLETHYRRVMEQRTPDSFHYQSRITGLWYDIRVYPSHAGILVYYIDITSQQRLEQAERETQVIYRAIAQNIPNSVVHVVDLELRYRVVEGAIPGVLDLPRKPIEGRRVDEVFSGPVLELLLPRYQRALAGETTRYETEFQGRRFSAVYTPLRDDSGQIFAAMAFTIDTTPE